ncbi:DUF6456 domain-containing protein [Terrihabitans sp. B22-R8]|uniref:DUF6456 domain-containing protein n=1 Tax=Terrihabitans sp. B22-R8 TaxID=3425128 RepID=UPI00403C5D86
MFVLTGERLSLPQDHAHNLVVRDLAYVTPTGFLLPTEAGHFWARRHSDGEEDFRRQHGAVQPSNEIAPGARIDLAESPLLWLHRRKDRNGQPLIGEAMFAAGERLRSDFTFANLGPRVSSSWTGVRSATTSDQSDPTDRMVSARQRVRKALDHVGPELSGVLLDVCCFLKGLEDVERDRQWPARSAKIILALALGRLAGHYGYSDVAKGPDRVRPRGQHQDVARAS